jgi:hypothetical protein
LGLAALLAVALVWLRPQGQPVAAIHVETAVLRSVAALRAGWLTPVMRVFGALGMAWSVTILGWGPVAALIVFKAVAAPGDVPGLPIRPRGPRDGDQFRHEAAASLRGRHHR